MYSMDSKHSDRAADGAGRFITIKILVAGGFGVGKTTLVNTLSEVRPLCTEEQLTEPGADIDVLDGVESKTTTTVAMDYGRITIRDGLVVYLFGTPGQERFWFMWDDLSYGALGAVVLADTRRLTDCFPSVDYFEHRGTPFIVAVNCFDGAGRYDPADIRAALDLYPDTPVVLCDARRRESSKQVLIALVEHAIRLLHRDARRDSPAGADPSARAGNGSAERVPTMHQEPTF
jgi:signal recognition particle receptor subunit beta